MKVSGLGKLCVGAAIGASVGYVLDPDRGRARRARLGDQVRADLRRGERDLVRRARYGRGRLTGMRRRFDHTREQPLADDHVLIDRVRSQALGRLPELAHRISSDACNGVVTLRGQVDDVADIERAEVAVRRVAGVEHVTNLLHTAGESPANKRDALRAGA